MICRNLWLCTVALFVFASGLASCATPQAPASKTTLTVFAAQSLKRPFSKAAPLFEAENPGVELQFNYGGSGTLAAQLASGAAADVFASAGSKEMDMLEGKGLIDSASRRNFAGNTVVLVAPAGDAGKLTGFADLALPQVKRIAVGDPKLAPVGLYAAEVFSNYGISENIASRLIPCAQVAQACDYTARGEVDAGVVYMTDYLARKADLVLIAEAPAASHQAVEYPAAVLVNSAHKDTAARFIAFLRSGAGAAILREYGFREVSANR
jgi:molybdate transport system substrate-binding protein